MICRRCGKNNPDGLLFCGGCGAKLNYGPPVSPTVYPASAARKTGNRGLIAAIIFTLVMIILVSAVWIYRIQNRETVTEQVVPNGILAVGSKWTGTMTLSNYQGSRHFNSDTIAVDAYFGRDESGKTYFELYEAGQRKNALISMYVNLYQDHFVPVIGTNDAWILDVYLSNLDTSAMTGYVENGQITLTYAYDITSCSCDMELHLHG